MMAVSAFHHYGTQAALPYKVTAVRCLSSSLASDSAYGAAETQAAASLMLCVYSVGYIHFLRVPEHIALTHRRYTTGI
jgi:hypothetical protein